METYKPTDSIWIHLKKESSKNMAKLMLISDLLLPGRIDQHEELMHTSIKSYADIDITFSNEIFEPEYQDGPSIWKLKPHNDSKILGITKQEESAFMENLIKTASIWMEEPVEDLAVATSHKYSRSSSGLIIKVSVHIVGQKKYYNPKHFIESRSHLEFPEHFDKSVYHANESRKFRCINSASSDGRIMLPYNETLTIDNISNYIVQSKSLCVMPFITSIPKFSRVPIDNTCPKKIIMPETDKLIRILVMATDLKVDVPGGYTQWLSCIFHASQENVPKDIVIAWSRTVRPQHDFQKVSNTYDRAKITKSKNIKGIYMFLEPYILYLNK